jgi:hypothetical protein
VAAAPAEPRFDAGPPSAPLPAHAPGQRRFNFLIVGLTILLAAGLVGGLLIFNRSHANHAPASRTTDEARNVADRYLAYSAAAAREIDQLQMAPVQPFLTDAGAKQEQQILHNVALTGYRYRLTAEHSPKAVVYSNGDLASIDDVVIRHTVPLDMATGTPAAPERSDTIHQSVALKKQNGDWFVDSVVAFGTAVPEGRFDVSYAAATVGKPLQASLAAEIGQAYENYWIAETKAFKTLDPTPLAAVEAAPSLKHDTELIEGQRLKHQGYQIRVQHNLRIAQQDAGTIWVYDTYEDSSYSFDLQSGNPVGTPPSEIIREAYKLQRADGNWKIFSSVQFK